MKYFTLSEFTRSATANEYNIDNRADVNVANNIADLVEYTLDPLRELWGKPLKVNSGYRCPLLNKKVGGAANSSHMYGHAADITAGSKDANRRLWYTLINSNIPYTKIINEQDFSWIHISFKIGNVTKTRLRAEKVNGVWKYYNV